MVNKLTKIFLLFSSFFLLISIGQLTIAQQIAGLPQGTTLSDVIDTYWSGTVHLGYWRTLFDEQSAGISPAITYDTLYKDYYLPYNLRLLTLHILWQGLNTDILQRASEYGVKVVIGVDYNRLWEFNDAGFSPAWQIAWAESLPVNYPNALCIDMYGNSSIPDPDKVGGDYVMMDPNFPEYKSAIVDWYKLIWDRAQNFSSWIGFTTQGDGAGSFSPYPTNPTLESNGYCLSEYSLNNFTQGSYFTGVNMVTGEHRDGTTCQLWDMFINQSTSSPSYDVSLLPSLWQEIETYHQSGFDDHLHHQMGQRIAEAIQEFETYTGRHWIQTFIAGGRSVLIEEGQNLGVQDWYDERWQGMNWSFQPFPDDQMGFWIYRGDDSPVYMVSPAGVIGNNGGAIEARQLRIIMTNGIPRYPSPLNGWDITPSVLRDDSQLSYYKNYSTILARMRYPGIVRQAGTNNFSQATQTTQVHWSYNGGQNGNPLLAWYSNAKLDESFDLNFSTSLNATTYGLNSGPWYAFDVATMSLVGSGNDASNVSLSFDIPAWEWRPIYIFSGEYNPTQTKLLYSSSKPLSEATQGSNLRLVLDGHSGMYYKVASQSPNRPSIVTKKLSDGSAIPLPELANREAVLNTVAVEGWYYDNQRNILLVSYKANI